MSRAATSRLKVNPQLGSPPSLEFRTLAELKVDDTYQRSLETDPSQRLIRRIAQFWDWGLCQPLAVARRQDGSLMVVDGQHRLAAATLRGDIAHLPCVITSYANTATRPRRSWRLIRTASRFSRSTSSRPRWPPKTRPRQRSADHL
jgi:hypothetical protein